MDWTETVDQTFWKQKHQLLEALDHSRKGSIDQFIIPLVHHLNQIPQYFTTSSCSGRIIIAGHKPDNQYKKKGCLWIYVTHDLADVKQMKVELRKVTDGDYFLKFEPFILHVQCANLEAARYLLQTAVAAGYRNSGISLGKKGKIITAIRTTANLQVPLVSRGKLLVSDEYIEYLAGVANEKMAENQERIRFFKSLLIFKDMDVKTSISERTTPIVHDTKQTNQATRQSNPSPEADYSLDDSDDTMLDDLFNS